MKIDLKSCKSKKKEFKLRLKNKNEEVVVNIESKKIDIEKQLEEERVQREEDHIAWKLSVRIA